MYGNSIFPYGKSLDYLHHNFLLKLIMNCLTEFIMENPSKEKICGIFLMQNSNMKILLEIPFGKQGENLSEEIPDGIPCFHNSSDFPEFKLT